MRYAIISLCVLPTMLFSVSTFAGPADIKLKEPNTLTVCSYSKFKPISYGNGEGYEADLLRAIAKRWQMNIKFYPERIYEGIWRSPSRPYTRCDLAAGGITPADYRVKEDSAFSLTTMSFQQSLLVRKQDYMSKRITSYRSFNGTSMKIGVVPGTTGERYAQLQAQQAGLPMSVFVQYPSESDLLPALKNGQIDAIARGEIGNEYQSQLDHSLVTIAKKDFHEGFSFAVDRSNPHLLTRLNQAISDITDHGKIAYPEWARNHNVFMQRVM